MHLLLFVHQFICRWTVGCFHLLAIGNNAAIITYVQLSLFLSSVLLSMYSAVNLLGHMIILFLICWGNTILFFHSKFTVLSEKAMAPHSSTLAWKIPWTEEPGGLQTMGSRRDGNDWATSLSLFTFMHWKRKWQPTPVFLPGESQGWGSLVPSLGSHRVGHDWSDLAAAADYSLIFLPAMHMGSNFSTLSANTCFHLFFFFLIGILVDMKWYESFIFIS